MTFNIKPFFTLTALSFSLLLLTTAAVAQVTWPAGQLLPSFPATAGNLDLFYNNGTAPLSWRWEAEGPQMAHHTGRLETDGWLCQVGIDAANEHMLYGPYDNSVTAGSNMAEFRMKIDNNTADNNPVVDIDVRDATTGAILAAQTITRQQFTIASNYTSFKLPFTMPAANHSIELRVFWKGAAYIKVDWVGVQQQTDAAAETYLFSSLKGIVNRTQPRIFSYEGDAFAEGPYAWMQSLGLTWTEHTDRWELISKYRSEISGLIVYDPAQTATVNLATTLAKDKKALIASPALLPKLTAAPYNLPILTDLRGQFTSKLQVYQTLYNTYWPTMDHRLLIGLSPELHQGSLREYATALGAAVIWLDPAVSGESALLNSFLSSMPAGSAYMGWWPEEGAGITRASSYGIATVASDYATNLTVHSGMPRTVNIKPIPPKPTLKNKIYVAFILSDGDNLQYVEHLMRKLWSNPDRGAVPMGWTLSPAMLDAMPGALNYYHQTATDNDNLISGPSGYGYVYPNNFPDQNTLNQFVIKTEDYNKRAGFRVLTVWNTITGGINQNVGESFATYAPSLLGLTAQNTGGALSIYNQRLPGMPLSCNYCTGEQAMKDAIAAASAGWNGATPRFIIIQAQPWQDVKPTNFKNVMNSLDSNHIVVRPDHLFQLLREENGLPAGDSLAADTAGTFAVQYQKGFPGDEKLKRDKDIVLYPNPASSKLYVSGLNNNAVLEVYDSKGQRLKTVSGISIDVSELVPGTYFLKIRSGETSYTRKFIKR
ncbi:T9SS type A sorting domain-containing protein [Chitinophaga sp. OAE865]|uniref:T9SS type A sorting domain-containing protein n=1 Tax=Chitinophaga sp. OAE865 TaxID=2817898 RepID=UPI001AE34D4F